MFSSELINVPAVRAAKDELAMLYELVGPLAAVNFSPDSDPCGSRKVSWDSTCALKRSKDSVMNRTTVSKVHRHRTQSAPQRPLPLDVSEEASSVCRLWNGLCEKWMQYEDQLSRLADIETQYRTILVQLLELLSSEKRNGFDSVHSERLFKKFDEHPSLCGDHESWGFLTTDEQKLLRSVECAFQSLVQNTDAWKRAPSPQPSLVHHPPKVVSSAVKHSDGPGGDDKNDPPTQALSRAEACIRTVPRSLLFELFRIQSTLLGNSRLPLNPEKPLTSVEEASPGTFPQPDAAWSCVNDHCFDLPARYHSTVANALHVLQRLDTTSGPSQGGRRDNDDCIGNGPSGWSLRLLRDTYEQALEAKQQLFDARKLEGELSTAREVVHATTAQYERDTQKYLNRLHQLGQRLAAQEKVLTEGSQQVRDQCAVLNKIQREGQAALRENLRCITRHAVQAHLLQRRTGGLHRAVTEIEQCVVQRCTQLRDNVQALDRGGELLSLLHRTLRLRRRSEEKYVDGVFRKAQEALLSAHEQILEQAVRRTE